MFYLKNPYDRIVCIDDHEKFTEWLKKPGFREPSKKEIEVWQKARTEAHEARKVKAEVEKSPTGGNVFLATVSGGRDGYGMASTNLFRELTKLEVKISYYNKGQKVGLLFHAPYSISRVDTDYRILYTMFESTKIPDDWPEYLKEANKVLVPSKWCQSVFKKSGIETEVVPLGYDDRIFKFHQRKVKREEKQEFVFLHYNAYNLRKGFIELVKAFTQEFERGEPVKMIFKTNLPKPPFPFDSRKYPNIEVIKGGVPVYQLADICRNADAFVFPSRGEGFGITPLEAMATGLPTIVPNAHGISEYFDPKFMYEVKIEKEVPAAYHRYRGQDVGQMFQCDVKHLRNQMRYIYEHQEDALHKGKLASEYVKKYTYAKTAQKLKAILDDIMGQPIPERKATNVLPLEEV